MRKPTKKKAKVDFTEEVDRMCHGMFASNGNGKGSKPRPVNKKVFDNNFDSVFKPRKLISGTKFHKVYG